MPVSFHDISVAVYNRCLPAVGATMDKASAHFDAGGVLEEITTFALAADMKPFRYQIQSVVHHSLGALDGLRSGRFAPPPPGPAWSWTELRDLVSDAARRIASVPPEEAEDLARREVLFEAGGRRRLFTATEFVLAFSVPNLHFHAATAYDILRLKGAPLGKRDYLGRVPGRDPAVVAP